MNPENLILVNRDGQDLGYFSLEVLREDLSKGILRPDDWAFCDGLTDWVKLEDMVRLKAQPIPLMSQSTDGDTSIETHSGFFYEFKIPWHNFMQDNQNPEISSPGGFSIGYLLGKLVLGVYRIMAAPIGCAMVLCIFAVPIALIWLALKGIDSTLGDSFWVGFKVYLKFFIRLPLLLMVGIIPIGIGYGISENWPPGLKLIAQFLGWVGALIAAVLLWKALDCLASW